MLTRFRRRSADVVLLLLAFAGASCQPVAVAPPSPAVPARIVSLIPSATELIYEVGAGGSLVGVTVNDDYPPEVEKLAKVGDQTIDPERLLSLRPDLVVLDTEFNADSSKYQRLGLPVLALSSKRLADIGGNMHTLGRRLGHEEGAKAAAERFQRSLDQLPRLDVKEKVFVEVWGSPLMTVGAETLPDDLLRQLGLSNVYADQKNYFQVDPEDVVSRRPGIVILAGQLSDTSKAAELLAKAGAPPRVIVLDGDLFTNPTPRVVQGLEQLSRELSSEH